MLIIFHSSQKGFTLIELMIVVTIIGILVTLALPLFARTTTKSKQSEAKQILKQIYIMQQTYRSEYNLYWGNGISAYAATAASRIAMRRINVDIGSTARYTYRLVAAANTFTCTATSGILDNDVTVDTWTMNQLGVLTCTSNDVTN